MKISAVIRECFPTSILLGSIDNPVEPTSTCKPEDVESDTIQVTYFLLLVSKDIL